MPALTSAQIESQVCVHNILFATDFTHASQKAFRYAKAFTRHFQATLMPAHVLRASAQDWPRFGADPEYKKLWHETKRELDALCRQLRQAGFQANSILLEGDPVERILEAAKSHKADLLVLGTHGAKDLERLFLGSTAEAILRAAPCPVLTVGPNVHSPHGELLLQKVLLATDFSPEAAAAAPYAFSLATEQASHVSVCHVLPEGHTKTMDSAQLQTKFMQAMNHWIPEGSRKNRTTEYVVEYGNAADEILKLAKEQHADLIVLGVHSSSVLTTHLLPGVAFRIIASASCPVLTVRK